MFKYFDPGKIPGLMKTVLTALPVTFKLVALSVFFGLLLGTGLAAMGLSKNRVLQAVDKGYVAFMRGMPTLILIFILYFVSPIWWRKIGIDAGAWSKDSFIILTLALVSAANFSEMMRSSFLAVPKNQWEAAYSIGMTGFTAFRRIIFPQAFAVAVPILGNIIVTVFKSTSLAFSIGAVDMFGKAKLISNRLYGLNKAELYFGVALIFWVICVALEQLTKMAERAASKGRREASHGF